MKRTLEPESTDPAAAAKKGNFRPLGTPAPYPQPVPPALRPAAAAPAPAAPAPATGVITTQAYRLTHNPQAAAAAANGQPYRQLKVEDALNYLDKVRESGRGGTGRICCEPRRHSGCARAAVPRAPAAPLLRVPVCLRSAVRLCRSLATAPCHPPAR